MNAIAEHLCPHCQEKVPSWFAYKMHLELHRKTETKIAEPKEKINMALKHGVKQPLTDSQKAAVVAKGEARVGLQHFIGEML